MIPCNFNVGAGNEKRVCGKPSTHYAFSYGDDIGLCEYHAGFISRLLSESKIGHRPIEGPKEPENML